MSRSVGSGPMPQAVTAAAPAPVTPRTFRKRLRSIESVISVMTHAAVARDFVFDVAPHAPPHAQGRDLLDLGRVFHVAVARRAGLVSLDAQPRAQSLDVAHVRETHETGKRVDAHPLRRLPLAPGVADFLDLGLMGRGGPADQLMAADAGLERRNPRLAR